MTVAVVPPLPDAAGLDSTTAATWNAILSHAGQPLPLRAGLQARFSPADPPVSGPVLDLRPEGGPDLAVVVESFPFAGLLGVGLTVRDLPVLPGPLRAALEEGMIATLSGALPDLGLATLGRHGRVWRETGLHWFRVELHGLAPEPVVLRVGAAMRDLLDAFSGMRARPAWPNLRRTLSREATRTLGRLPLPLSALGSLREGGAVLIDADLTPDMLLLRAGTTTWRFVRQGPGWLCRDAIDHEARRRRRADNQDLPMSAARLPSDLAPDLDVAVDLDLGSVDVPFADMEAWVPGSLVVLPEPLTRDEPCVTLRVNGRAVGTGDLVRIDDRLAVRIARLAQHPG